MNVPQLPGSPHLPTLGYLVLLLAVGGLILWICLTVRDSRQA